MCKSKKNISIGVLRHDIADDTWDVLGAVHVSLPFLLELRCPYSRLRSIAITAWGMAAYTATTTVTSNSGCGANATRTIAGAGSWLSTETLATNAPIVYLYRSVVRRCQIILLFVPCVGCHNAPTSTCRQRNRTFWNHDCVLCTSFALDVNCCVVWQPKGLNIIIVVVLI